MSDFALPEALQRGIDECIGGISGRDIAVRTAALSGHYRAHASSRIAILNEVDIAAYLVARLPATYAATLAAIEAVKVRMPDFAPRSMLDAGCGPGTASWAALECWGVEQITLLDENDAMLRAARTLQSFSGSEALRGASIIKSGVPEHLPANPHDLVVLAYALAELPESRWSAALSVLWRGTASVLLIVEPGTPEGYRRILAARAMLLELGAHVAAPCPHDAACPLTAPDWCHFAQRLPRSRDHMRAKGGAVPFEDEKFSYLAVTRDAPLGTPSARILDRPKAEKAGFRFKLCNAGGLADLLLPKRDKPAYRAVSRKKWGETLD